MVAKLRLRIVDGIPEVDGDPDQIMEVLRRLSTSPQSARSTPPREGHESSTIQDPKEIDPNELVNIIESNGEPMTFSMGDLQKRLYGRRFSSKDEKELYEPFRRAFDKAKTILEEKYPDYEWKSVMTNIDGTKTKRFTMTRRKPSMPVQQQIKTPDKTPTPRPQEEEVDLFNM